MTTRPTRAQGKRGTQFIAGAMFLLACGFAGHARGATPDLEILAGEVRAIGGSAIVDPHDVPLLPAYETGYDFASSGPLEFSRISLAFDTYVDLFPNQKFLANLDPGTGISTLEFPLWVIDSDGDVIEVPTVLTTEMVTTVNCKTL